jgi:putative phosphoesterase
VSQSEVCSTKLLLISDVHANLEALEEVLNHANFDEVLFMGDVVDYGPSPVEVFDLLRFIRAKRVLGNHDVAASFKKDCRSSQATHAASVATREEITWKLLAQKSLDLLGKAERKLDLEYDGMRLRAFHGAPGDELYRYVTKEEAASLDMDGADLLVLGHTHNAYEVRKEGLWVVNPGSVGFPADNDPRASYAVLDTRTRQTTFGRIKYDVDGVVSKLHNLVSNEQVFQVLEDWLRTGQRPTIASNGEEPKENQNEELEEGLKEEPEQVV